MKIQEICKKEPNAALLTDVITKLFQCVKRDLDEFNDGIHLPKLFSVNNIVKSKMLTPYRINRIIGGLQQHVSFENITVERQLQILNQILPYDRNEAISGEISRIEGSDSAAQ